MTSIALSRMHFPIRALGPGKRIGIWFQGCSIRCPGCISLDTWQPGVGLTSVEAVVQRLSEWAKGADGLTISGGEPLDQPEALSELLQAWRDLSQGSVLVFTGNEWEQVQPWFEDHAGLVDAVVAGRYLQSVGDALALRGSDNQTLHILSSRGEAFRAFERPKSRSDRQLDVMFDDDGSVWFAGIPAKGDFRRLSVLLEGKGHKLVTSAQTREVAQ